jgi:hypothetical protein
VPAEEIWHADTRCEELYNEAGNMYKVSIANQWQAILKTAV